MAADLRHVHQLARDCGLAVDRIDARARHPKLYVRAPDGRAACFTVPRSPSDHRALLNKRSQLRAFAEGRHHSADNGGRHATRD